MDSILSRHFAHILVRDPVVLFSNSLLKDDKETTDMFEVAVLPPPLTPQSLQSTNWNTVRFKPPPLGSGKQEVFC